MVPTMLELANTTLEELVNSQLRPLSTSIVNVASLTQDFEASAREIANAIGCDPVLAGRVMRAANSAFYALDRAVTTLPNAVNTLGNARIHSMVMAFAAMDAFRNARSSAAERELWEHCLAVGVAAREISNALRMRGSEEAFLCGLLHDVGKLLMLNHNAKLYALTQSGEVEDEHLQREKAVYGFTHSQVSGVVAHHWDFPKQLVGALECHHEPEAVSESIVLAHVISAADTLANANGRGTRTLIEPQRAGVSAIELGLDDEKLIGIWERTEAGLNEMLRFLGE